MPGKLSFAVSSRVTGKVSFPVDIEADGRA
jgi:hypothetical protein